MIDFSGPIALPAADYDYVPDCVSHRGQVSLGSKNHLGSDASLTCTIRTNINSPYWSGLSEDDTLSAQCADDEVMTSCFSFNKVLVLLTFRPARFPSLSPSLLLLFLLLLLCLN